MLPENITSDKEQMLKRIPKFADTHYDKGSVLKTEERVLLECYVKMATMNVG